MLYVALAYWQTKWWPLAIINTAAFLAMDGVHACLGRGRVKVLRAEALFAAPEAALNGVLAWLALPPFERGALAPERGALFTRARGSGGRAAEVADGDDGGRARARALCLRDEDVNALRAWYAPHNAELARLLALHGVPFEPWAEVPDNTARRRRRRR